MFWVLVYRISLRYAVAALSPHYGIGTHSTRLIRHTKLTISSGYVLIAIKQKSARTRKKNPNFKFFTMSFSLPPLIRSSMESITCFVCTGDDNSPLNIYYLGIYHPFLSVSESMIPYFLFIANFASRNFPLWLLKFMSTAF